ncbi:hypothetical protein [Mycobacterium sp. AZCC_0083]|uniref:hypothetical protein n=1 Tax=Mycobacterium sp. AZCC_0083 TaxID=2735882 RepID=UPI00161E974C|nr:hypothetical protein [Mycobacterium sp. AZCC_0083]MBB5167577.1 hypothetical protein [Mycobacterium sp. AZCC_0083]
MSYNDALAAMQGADDDALPGHRDGWRNIAGTITANLNKFQLALAAQEQLGDWQGKTHDAVMENVNKSFIEPQTVANGALIMSYLSDVFAKTLSATKHYLTDVEDTYRNNLNTYPELADQIHHDFDSYAQAVLNNVYGGGVKYVSENNPAFSSGQTTNLKDVPAPPPAPPDLSKASGPGTPPGGPNDPTGPPSNLLEGPSGGPFSPGAGPSGASLFNNPGISPSGGPGLAPLNDTLNAPGAGGLDPNLGTQPLSAPPGAPGDPFTGPGSSLTTPAGSPNDPSSLLNNPGSLLNDPSSLLNNPGGLLNTPAGGLGGSTGPASGLSNLAATPNSGGGPAAAAAALGPALQSAQSALGPAGEALQRAAGAAQNRPAGAMPPEGALGLGPKGLNALTPAGGPHGGGGGGGAGLGPRGGDLSAPPGSGVAPSRGFDTPAAGQSATGAPLGGMPGGGGPGAGAGPGGGGPSGGQRGAPGKEHKPNKELRRKKNGRVVLGDVDAVVAVIGDDGHNNTQRPSAERAGSQRPSSERAGAERPDTEQPSTNPLRPAPWTLEL